jgi:hypothetical protein
MRLKVASVLALMLFACPAAGFAQDQGTPEEQKACEPDVYALCGEDIPDADKITACLIKKKAQLSADCRKVFSKKRPKRG